ncbi:MAG: hypothetical protein MUF15_22105 [Acidobacteria bacterium]|jgi:hypothetical protein|nr:hypothetical protein [Acidobacteriota bacterium]
MQAQLQLQIHQATAENEFGCHCIPQPQLKPGTEKLESDTVISLINSPLYYLDWAFITHENERYRLIVSQFERIITDRYFESLESAKVGFLKIFQYLAFSEYQPAWSHPYTPYNKWLQVILKKIAIRYYN